jgi:hypothetical protein
MSLLRRNLIAVVEIVKMLVVVGGNIPSYKLLTTMIILIMLLQEQSSGLFCSLDYRLGSFTLEFLIDAMHNPLQQL